jgi:hypothetical protein
MKTKLTGVCLPVLLSLLSGSFSFGQIQAPHETSASRVVWHFVARSLVNPSNRTSQVIGYFTDLDGVSVSLFRGTPSETTACLTLRTDVFTAQPLPNNGSIALSVPGPVILHLYFNPSHSNNWNDPDTFSSGQEVARFNRSANVSVSDGSISSATFSLDLLFSQDFTINGQEVNFAKIAPHGVTNSNIGSTTPVTGSGNFTLALPFVAAGIAIGNDETHGQWESADQN